MVPAEAPAVTMPDGLTVAVPGALLLQVPPALPMVSVIVLLVQRLEGPEMTPGDGFMVMDFNAKQPALVI